MADLFHDKNISPMLLNEVKEPFDDKDYIYELKLDGIRCIAYLGKEVVLQNKRCIKRFAERLRKRFRRACCSYTRIAF